MTGSTLGTASLGISHSEEVNDLEVIWVDPSNRSNSFPVRVNPSFRANRRSAGPVCEGRALHERARLLLSPRVSLVTSVKAQFQRVLRTVTVSAATWLVFLSVMKRWKPTIRPIFERPVGPPPAPTAGLVTLLAMSSSPTTPVVAWWFVGRTSTSKGPVPYPPTMWKLPTGAGRPERALPC